MNRMMSEGGSSVGEIHRVAPGLTLLLMMVAGCGPVHAPAARDAHVRRADDGCNYWHDHSPTTTAGTIRAVVEIPAGTNAKWEVAEDGSTLAWEMRDGRPRVVAYLPYPGNYGMIPRTLEAQVSGGDGDPADVLVLGPALPRGAVVEARLVGVLRMRDDGERDDKFLAVPHASPLAEVDSLAALDARYPGVTFILKTWFTHYKGPGRVTVEGFGDRAEAQARLEAVMADYRAAHAN